MSDTHASGRDTDDPEMLSDPVYDAFGNHVFIIMSVIAKRFGRSASAFFRRNYGIGVMEWRIACVLGHAPELGASEISERTDMDRAAVSRSLRVLERLGWVEIERTGNSTPRKLIRLTELGRRTRAEVIELSLRRQEAVFSQLDEARVEALRDNLRYLVARTREVEKFYSDDTVKAAGRLTEPI